MNVAKEPLRYRLNPCDMARFRVLKPVGDALAWGWQALTSDITCACCLGLRVLGLVGIGALAGAIAATLFLR